jgi:hypothetical protein
VTLITEIIDPQSHNGFMETQMVSTKAVEVSTQYLKAGRVVSVEGKAEGITATVLTIDKDKLGLELLGPVFPAFQVGDPIRVIYWEGEDPATSCREPVISCWEARVVDARGPSNRHLMIALLGEKVERSAINKERRKDPRWSTSIPCTVEWLGHQITGEVANISLGGALITKMLHPADQGRKVLLSIRAETTTIQLVCSVTSKVIRRSEELKGDKAAWMAVRFEERSSKLKSKLGPLLTQLASKAQPKQKA